MVTDIGRFQKAYKEKTTKVQVTPVKTKEYKVTKASGEVVTRETATTSTGTRTRDTSNGQVTKATYTKPTTKTTITSPDIAARDQRQREYIQQRTRDAEELRRQGATTEQLVNYLNEPVTRITEQDIQRAEQQRQQTIMREQVIRQKQGELNEFQRIPTGEDISRPNTNYTPIPTSMVPKQTVQSEIIAGVKERLKEYGKEIKDIAKGSQQLQERTFLRFDPTDYSQENIALSQKGQQYFKKTLREPSEQEKKAAITQSIILAAPPIIAFAPPLALEVFNTIGTSTIIGSNVGQFILNPTLRQAGKGTIDIVTGVILPEAAVKTITKIPNIIKNVSTTIQTAKYNFKYRGQLVTKQAVTDITKAGEFEVVGRPVERIIVAGRTNPLGKEVGVKVELGAPQKIKPSDIDTAEVYGLKVKGTKTTILKPREAYSSLGTEEVSMFKQIGTQPKALIRPSGEPKITIKTQQEREILITKKQLAELISKETNIIKTRQQQPYGVQQTFIGTVEATPINVKITTPKEQYEYFTNRLTGKSKTQINVQEPQKQIGMDITNAPRTKTIKTRPPRIIEENIAAPPKSSQFAERYFKKIRRTTPTIQRDELTGLGEMNKNIRRYTTTQKQKLGLLEPTPKKPVTMIERGKVTESGKEQIIIRTPEQQFLKNIRRTTPVQKGDELSGLKLIRKQQKQFIKKEATSIRQQVETLNKQAKIQRIEEQQLLKNIRRTTPRQIGDELKGLSTLRKESRQFLKQARQIEQVKFNIERKALREELAFKNSEPVIKFTESGERVYYRVPSKQFFKNIRRTTNRTPENTDIASFLKDMDIKTRKTFVEKLLSGGTKTQPVKIKADKKGRIFLFKEVVPTNKVPEGGQMTAQGEILITKKKKIISNIPNRIDLGLLFIRQKFANYQIPQQDYTQGQAQSQFLAQQQSIGKININQPKIEIPRAQTKIYVEKIIKIPKTKLENTQKIAIATMQEQSQAQRQAQQQSQFQIQEFKQIQAQSILQGTKVGLRQLKLQANIQLQKQISLQQQIQIPRIDIPPITIPKIKTPKKPNFDFEESKSTLNDLSKTSRSVLGYSALLKIRGKYVEVAKNLSRAKALDVLAQQLKSKLARTGKLVQKGKALDTSTSGTYPRYAEEFRTYKIVKGRKVALTDTLIQKARFSLGTKAEVKAIQMARKGVNI